ncbi:MAG: DUF3341 domain-containing protein [Candidatus Angelobacter sp.]
MPKSFLVATFSDAETLMKAVRTVTEEDFRIYDVYAPYPIHGLDHAMGIRRTRLPWVTFLVGCCALTLAITFQFYTTVLDWPLNVGGKPDNSTLAFIPICFELTVLLSGLATVAALFLRARLYPGKKELLLAEGVTNDTFALVLRRRETAFDIHRAWKLLEESGADRVKEREVA